MSVKPFKTYAGQLQILKDRGLMVADDAKVLHLLEHHNCYRLSAYRFPFQDTVDHTDMGFPTDWRERDFWKDSV